MTTSTLAVSVRPAPSRSWQVLDWLVQRPSSFTLLLIVLVCAIVGAINPTFYSVANLFDILRASVVLGLFALGVLVVLAAGGLDVSFAAIAALVMYSLTKAVVQFWPEAPFAIILAAGAAGGALLGALNGLLVHRLNAPSLIVTIGTQYVFRGFLLTFVGTELFMNVPQAMDAFGKATLVTLNTSGGGQTQLPVFVLVLIAAALLTWWLLERTLMGRAVFAIGGSLTIAERLGYNLRTVHVFVFAYAGMLAGVAGLMHVAANRLANPFDLSGIELDVIAAVVLGGARITGGRGSVGGTLLGVLLVALINNVLILAGVPSTWQKAVIGIFIVLAGAVFAIRRRG